PLPVSGGSGTVLVQTLESCQWTARSNAEWIVLTGGLSGTGPGVVSYSAPANPNPTARTGTVSIGDQTFTLTQPGTCSLTLRPGLQTFTPVGDTNSVEVSVSNTCSWTATSSVSWILLSTNGGGGGNYCPDAAVTREQMAIFIERSLGEFNPPTPTTQRFNDVPPERASYAFIADFAARGITAGCGQGNFCPDQEVTRGPMAAF